MCRKSTEVDGADRAVRADRAGGECKVLEAVKWSELCQSSLGQTSTRLGLLLACGT
jgi:hypothetical protein